MATLEIINNFSLDSNGRIKTGKQGAAADGFSEEFPLAATIAGTCHFIEGLLSTAAVLTVFDDDDDVPADWDYLYFWADQDMYIQLISTTNVIFKCQAKVPFTLSYDSLLAAANATAITGGTEPTLVDIDSVVLGNYSGTPANFLFALID